MSVLIGAMMHATEAYEFRNYLRQRGIIFSYSGYMTEPVLTGIGDALKRKLELDGTDLKTARTIFSVFVEQVQNVIRYSAEIQENNLSDKESDLRYGVLTVGYEDGKHIVSCGNMVEQHHVDRLRESLWKIKTSDNEELKKLFKETLRGETPEGSKGAGVGFIDIARRATRGFEFDFCAVSEDRAYFVINAYI